MTEVGKLTLRTPKPNITSVPINLILDDEFNDNDNRDRDNDYLEN